jgi:hypothetical protein
MRDGNNPGALCIPKPNDGRNNMYIERNERFDDSINDISGPVVILGLTFDAADILYKCDPIAYRVYSADFDDAMEESYA